MGLYTVILSVAFLSGVFSSMNYDEPEDELIASDDQSVASFFDYWIPRMRMRGRRSVDAKPSDLHQGTAKSAKRFWNSNQKDVMSFLDAYKQGGDGKLKRFWNGNQKDMMSSLEAYKQGNGGKYKRFWNGNQKDVMSFLDAYKQGDDGKYKRFWNANQKDLMSSLGVHKQGFSESG